MTEENAAMFRRWAEARLYRKTMKVAVAELRRAARAANVLDKLEALDLAEQRLRDAQWLSSDRDTSHFEAGLAEIAQSRSLTLEQAITAVERLIAAAERELADPAAMLAPAGRILAFLNHYLPEDPRVEVLNGSLIQAGGKQTPRQPVPALREIYRRPDASVGCGSLIGLLALATMAAAAFARFLH